MHGLSIEEALDIADRIQQRVDKFGEPLAMAVPVGLHAELDEVIGNHRNAMSNACNMFEVAHRQAESERDAMIERALEADDLKNRALAIVRAACLSIDQRFVMPRDKGNDKPHWYASAIEAGFHDEPPF